MFDDDLEDRVGEITQLESYVMALEIEIANNNYLKELVKQAVSWFNGGSIHSISTGKKIFNSMHYFLNNPDEDFYA